MSNKINKYSGVSAVVYIKEDPIKFAVVRTKRGYSLPGGSIEKGDNSLESAIYREIKEELGLKPEDLELKETDIEESFQYDSNKDGRADEKVIRKIYLIKALKKELNPNDDEVIEASWVTYTEAMNMLRWDNAKDTLEKVILGEEI